MLSLHSDSCTTRIRFEDRDRSMPERTFDPTFTDFTDEPGVSSEASAFHDGVRFRADEETEIADLGVSVLETVPVFFGVFLGVCFPDLEEVDVTRVKLEFRDETLTVAGDLVFLLYVLRRLVVLARRA